MERVEKSFPGVRALGGVDLDLQRGEVLALLGENGAGKSTLIKVLAGAHRPDGGSIRIDGELVRIDDPTSAQRAGIAVIHQEFNLVPSLTAVDNIFLGQEATRFGFLRLRSERRRAREIFDRLGVDIDLNARCRDLTVAQQQVVEIAKALSLEARILVLDEPSAALTLEEVDRLLDMVRELRADGLGLIYISHRLEEVFAVADRVLVLRDGESVARARVADIDREELIECMVGRRLEDEFPPRQHSPGPVRLRVQGLTRGDKVRAVDFAARAGEVLGFAGLVGSGRTEIARLLFGADRRDAGSVTLDGRELDLRSPRHAIRQGIGLLTEDRKAQGLILGQSVVENFSLPNLPRLSAAGFVRRRLERSSWERYADALRIKTPNASERVRNLSGGNQQKVVLAKWLERQPDVIIFDEPTRGIDVGAKYEIYLLINQLAAEGRVVLMISSELAEILGVCDRVLVFHEGALRGEITDVPAATQESVLRLAVG